MAGAERIAASAITATASRAQHSPMRNFRPAFEDIMLSGGPLSAERAAVPQKLAAALGSLMESAREKDVEAQVDGILRTYASEIKNDIVLLTISRLRDLVQSLPPERLAPRLEDIPHLMREFPQAADTVPEIVMNAERMHGGSRLGLEPMRRMIRSVVGRSKSLCPKELFSVMRTDYESGKFDSIAGVAEARGTVAPPAAEAPQKFAMDNAPMALPETQQEAAPSPDMPRLAGPQDGREVPDSLHARPEMVWCDEVRPRSGRRDEPGPVFESVASVMRWDRMWEAAARRKDVPAEPAARAPRMAATPEFRLLRPIPSAARNAAAEPKSEPAPRPASRPADAAVRPEGDSREDAREPKARSKQAGYGKDAHAPSYGGLKAGGKEEEKSRATGSSPRAARRNAGMTAARGSWMDRIIAAKMIIRIKKKEQTKNRRRQAPEKAASMKPKRTAATEARARIALPKEKGRDARAKKAREAPGAGKALMQRERTGAVRGGAAGRRPAARTENAKAAEKRRSGGRRKRAPYPAAIEAGGSRRRRPATGSRMLLKPASGRRKEPPAVRKRKGGAAARALLGIWRSARSWRKGRGAPAGLRWPAAR